MSVVVDVFMYSYILVGSIFLVFVAHCTLIKIGIGNL